MDPTLAGFVGTIVGAAIAAFVPIAVHRINKREIERSERRAESDALLEVLLRLIKTRQSGDAALFDSCRTESIIALERLLLLANRRDAIEIQHVTQFAFNTVSNGDHLGAISASVEAMSMVLRRWCRGEIQGKKIGDDYGVSFDSRLKARTRKRL